MKVAYAHPGKTEIDLRKLKIKPKPLLGINESARNVIVDLKKEGMESKLTLFNESSAKDFLKDGTPFSKKI